MKKPILFKISIIFSFLYLFPPLSWASPLTDILSPIKKTFAKKHAVTSRLPTHIISIEEQVSSFPKRPKPLLEIGEPLLGTGEIAQGFQIPTGAVWQPSFIAWGNFRTAFQSFYNGSASTSEWANRLDLFGNLYLTPTERILAGIRALDNGSEFTGYTFEAPASAIENSNSYHEKFDFEITSLFFEGDLGEIFPNADINDENGFDIGFSIGRQPIRFQEGILINDNIDALGITKTNLKPLGAVNHRLTFLISGNELNRTNLITDDKKSLLYGLFNEIDYRSNTLEFDFIYIQAQNNIGKGIYTGIGSTQRIGKYNTAFRLLASAPINTETNNNRAGILLFSEISWNPTASENYIYLNNFIGFDQFRSASRDPLVGGPLEKTGILFEAVGLGEYASPLNNAPDDALGGALGYQMFFDSTRKQLIMELGARFGIDGKTQRALGPALRFQSAFGQRGIIRLDGYALYDENNELSSTNKNDTRLGGRIEMSYKF